MGAILPDVRQYLSADVVLAGFLSVITPLLVEMMAMPRPPNTLGTSSLRAYTRKPGLLIRRNPVTTLSLFGPYFRPILILPCGPLFLDLYRFDISFIQQNLRDGFLHIGRGDFYAFVPSDQRVADAGQLYRQWDLLRSCCILLSAITSLPCARLESVAL